MKRTFTVTIDGQADSTGMMAFLEALLTAPGVDGYEHIKCPAFIYGGPGHQSRHRCEYEFPHPLDGEHRSDDGRYAWEGTAVEEDYQPEGSCRVVKRLVSNPRNWNE